MGFWDISFMFVFTSILLLKTSMKNSLLSIFFGKKRNNAYYSEDKKHTLYFAIINIFYN